MYKLQAAESCGAFLLSLVLMSSYSTFRDSLSKSTLLSFGIVTHSLIKVVVTFFYNPIKMLFDAFIRRHIYIFYMYLLELWRVILLESEQLNVFQEALSEGIGKL